MTEKGLTCRTNEHGSRPLPAVDIVALERAAGMFRAMGDTPRLRLLTLLSQGEWCVTELVAALGEKFPTVSQRLRVLRGEGLVARRRQGTHVYYALADRHVADLIHNALAHADELKTTPQDLKESEDA
jgi:DNA-binding transcriptional ArsR family regulator